jgi:hypothetical protein
VFRVWSHTYLRKHGYRQHSRPDVSVDSTPGVKTEEPEWVTQVKSQALLQRDNEWWYKPDTLDTAAFDTIWLNRMKAIVEEILETRSEVAARNSTVKIDATTLIVGEPTAFHDNDGLSEVHEGSERSR